MTGFSIQDSGFRIQDSGELLLRFSLLPSQHFRHSREGGNPIFFFPKIARNISVASLGTTKMGFQTPFSFVSLTQRRRENVSGMTGVGVGGEKKDSGFRIQHLGFRGGSGFQLFLFSLCPSSYFRHPSEGWGPICFLSSVGGICGKRLPNKKNGMPACAGMTEILYGFFLNSVSLFYFTFSDDDKKWRRA